METTLKRLGVSWGRVEVPDYSRPNESDARYVTRWHLEVARVGGIYLHRYESADPRPTLHDHPWPFTSFVLRGGYREVRRYGAAAIRVRRSNVKRASDVHYIASLDRIPTWTLLVPGARCHTWGYVDPDGTWTAASEYRHTAELQAATSPDAGSSEGDSR